MVTSVSLLPYFYTIYKDATSQKDLGTALGYNTIVGGEGDDYMLSYGDYNYLYGCAGDDTIYSYGDYDNIYGGDGDDTIQYYGNNNYVEGGTGNDTIINSFFSMLQYMLPLLGQLSQLGTTSTTTTPTTTVTTPATVADTTTTTSAPALSESDVSTDGDGAWGDPHFDIKGANGNRIKFDHKGIDGHTYNIFTGDNLTIDAKYVPFSDPKNPQVMGKVSIKAGTQNITWDANGKPMVDGKELTKGETTLKDGTKVNYDGSKLTITSSDGNGTVKITADSSSGSKYLNIDPSGKFSNLGGILGTAYNESRSLSAEECNKFDVTSTRGIS